MNLARLTIIVAFGLFALDATHDASAGGSFLAVAVAAILLLAHGALLRDREDGAVAASLGMNRFAGAMAIVLIAAMASGFLLVSSLFAEPFLPKRSAPLGSAVLLAERVRDGVAPYRSVVPMAGFESEPAAAPGMVLAILSVRSWGLDPRWITVAGFFIAQGALLSLSLMAQRRGAATLSVLAPMVFSLCLSVMPRLLETAQSAMHPAHWVLIVLFGLSVIGRWMIPAALTLGLLAGASPGWLLLSPVIAAFLFRQHGCRAAIPLLAAAGLLLVFFGLFLPDTFELFQGIIGSSFVDGSPWRESPPNLWVRPSLAAPLQAMNALALGTAWAVAAIGFGAWKVRRANSNSEAATILAVCSCAVVALVPGTFAVHWIGHGLFVAMLGLAATDPFDSPMPARDWALFPLVLAMLCAPAMMRVVTGPLDGLELREGKFLAHTEGLRGAWNVPSHDHVWGAERVLDVAFPMTERAPGTLLTRVGFLGGEFTAYNEARVYLNGRYLGRIRLLPGAIEPVAITIPDRMLLLRGMNTLTFECAWTRSPQSLGLGDDPRTLSMIYYGLQWVPEAELHPRDIPAVRLIP